MSEELDKELRERISEVFEHYEDTAPADAGWQLLRERFPEPKKERRILPLWFSVAAVLLVLCVIGVYLYQQKPAMDEQVAATKPAQRPNVGPADTKASAQQSTGTNDTQNDAAVNRATTKPDQNSALYTEQKSGPVNDGLIVPERRDASATTVPATSADGLVLLPQQKVAPATTVTPEVKDRTSTNGIATTSPAIAQTSTGKDRSTVSEPYRADSVGKTDASVLAARSATKQPTEPSIMAADPAKANEKASRMEKLLASEQNKEAAKKLNKEVNADKRILYSVYAGTFFNYAEGSKSQINAGAGFSTDIKLARNIKLSTGVAIARNSLSYNGQPTRSGILNDAIVASTRSKDAQQFASPVIGQYNTALGIVPLRVVANPVVAGYDISLTGLDVPLNLKYEFNAKKSTDAYISAGISSGTFINETFRYNYDNTANALGSSESIPDASTRRSFASFDLARTLNLSVGMGYQITKGNRLVIEPFLKYPLNGMGSQQLRFGAGGVNLRLKFQTSKK